MKSRRGAGAILSAALGRLKAHLQPGAKLLALVVSSKPNNTASFPLDSVPATQDPQVFVLYRF